MSNGAKTFRERNAIYGDTWLSVGPILEDFLELPGASEMNGNELHCLVQIIGKVTRYISSGGHADSAHDIMVYAAMLESIHAKKEG